MKRATQIVHWPGKDTPTCDEHAEKVASSRPIHGIHGQLQCNPIGACLASVQELRERSGESRGCGQMKRARINVEIVSGAELRLKLGLPCFHCGRAEKICKATWAGSRGRRRCCGKCKGDPSHH